MVEKFKKRRIAQSIRGNGGAELNQHFSALGGRQHGQRILDVRLPALLDFRRR